MKKYLCFILFLICWSSAYCQTTISGFILNQDKSPVANATITIKGASLSTSSANDGSFHFILSSSETKLTLLISCIGYEPVTININDHAPVHITLRERSNELDRTVVIAYGTTTRRKNTGDVSKITASEISSQPVSNPLAALEGRVPGLLVSQSSGLPGSNLSVQIRGQNSISQGNQPLYIVDGVPFMLNSGSLAQAASSPTMQSPLNSINPLDIQSIEVLKDADATAIYGSQGANGVILITTKRSITGRTKLDLNYYSGFGQITSFTPLLNTSQYLQMRHEAFANDNVNPTIATAPDLLSWDTTRYTDWKKQLIGGTARIQDVQASLSAGNAYTQFLFSSGYRSETTVFPNSLPSQRGNFRFNLSHNSTNNKLRFSVSSAYSIDHKKMPYNDLTSFILLPPDAPPIYDSAGHLNWVNSFDNPYSYLLKKYDAKTSSLLSDALIQYELFPGLHIKSSFGYNSMMLDELVQIPIAAQRPSASVTGNAVWSTSNLKSWIAEPQAEYKRNISKGLLQVLVGLSFQERKQTSSRINANQYTNDDLLGSLGAAAQITASNSFSEYHYTAFFGRISYDWNSKFLLNINARRDGSSRFGPANRFANFGAIGAGYIFSEEDFIKNKLPFISFGKLRGSYGITGSDQVSDYQYYDSWSSSSSYLYAGVPGILPDQLYNSTLGWERNKKLEGALELGLLKDRILLSASYYQNRSDNQLVFYTLPSQTGFTYILKNLDALIQNSGWEGDVQAKVLQRGAFSWRMNANITIPKTKLLRYPGLDISSAKYNYIIGQPLNIFEGFHFLGVDPQTGVYQFEDINKDGKISSPADLAFAGFMGPQWYGGMGNTLQWKAFQLDVFVEYRKQTGRNYLFNLTTRPGGLSNQPTLVLDRWQKPGDLTGIEKFTTTATNPAYAAFTNLRNSSARISDASFGRLKNVSLSYTLPNVVLKRIHVQTMRVYVHAQNLFTITQYQGGDPETQSLVSLPPLKMITAGIQITF